MQFAALVEMGSKWTFVARDTNDRFGPKPTANSLWVNVCFYNFFGRNPPCRMRSPNCRYVVDASEPLVALLHSQRGEDYRVTKQKE